ncbi:hypothetical protein MRB53_030417 [Persea americana]|uniref:Uncharacterized protein n=1 Tax=Persea americana TaxID=3435 RepID=A0ACC2KLI9_PERAE|nr:hypothetical protein MRB53_030417 [Persea americana]
MMMACCVREMEMGGLGFVPDRDEMKMVGGFFVRWRDLERRSCSGVWRRGGGDGAARMKKVLQRVAVRARGGAVTMLSREMELL